MKVRELHIVPSNKIGRINKNNIQTKLHEDSTVLYLSQFGYDIDFVKPRNTNRARTADLMMQGSLWEMKSPTSFNDSTIKADFRKAASQSDRVIFDLRRIKKNTDRVEKQLIKVFNGRGRVRKMIIIRKNGSVLEFSR